MKKIIFYLVIIFVIICIFSFNKIIETLKSNYDSWSLFSKSDTAYTASDRVDFLNKNSTKFLTIALVGPFNKNNIYTQQFLQGAELAVNEINEKKGILGKKIKLKILNDSNVKYKAEKISQKLIRDKSIIAVLGHFNTNTTNSASVYYKKYGILLLSPASIGSKIGLYNNYFRNHPDYNNFAKAAVDYMNHKKYTSVIIFYKGKKSGHDINTSLIRMAEDNGITVESIIKIDADYNINYFKKSFNNIVPQTINYDSIIIIDNSIKEIRSIIKYIRSLEINVPILILGTIEPSPEILENFKYISMTSIRIGRSPELFNFTKKFRRIYNSTPGIWAIKGYDSIILIGNSINKSGSFKLNKINETLSKIKFNSLNGIISFDNRNNLKESNIYWVHNSIDENQIRKNTEN